MNSSWMALLPDDTAITEINMPGTHDSAACFSAFSFISKTQKLTVSKQLDSGVRYFDFRFRFESGEFCAAHSIAYCKLKRGVFAPKMTADDVVSYCREFLEKNPSETVLFQLKEAVSHTGDEFYSAFYKKYIADNRDLWYIRNSIPKLGEARGKIVLLRAVGVDKNIFDDTNSGIDFSNYPYVGSTEVDDWRKGDICSLDTGKPYAKMFVQDSYKVEGKKKWDTVVRFLENEDKCDFNICLTSCTRFFVPRVNVRYINRKLSKFNFQKGRKYGIVVADYIDNTICSRIIGSNDYSA